MSTLTGLFGRRDWREQMAFVVASMRELSTQTDPQQMRQAYDRRMRSVIPVDASLSLSRRGLHAPDFRVTRSSLWKEEVNPWKQTDRLPRLAGGLGAELLYGNEPRLLDDVEVSRADPLWPYLDGCRSVAAIPLYDAGVSLNMVLLMRRGTAAFDPEHFPQMVWMGNLYGRATHNLVLSAELKEAYEEVDHDLKVVADIQRSLLPAAMPAIPTMTLAASYQTSHRAGGDYYDFFALPGGRWGLLIADVSGHGTPAAVIMAVTHSLAHTYPGSHDRPGALLEYLNEKLYALYTHQTDAFVTAFYAHYDPCARVLRYAAAGHNPPRLKRCQDGSLALLDAAGGLPLGITRQAKYPDAAHPLVPGDQIVFYTDGVTEAHDEAGEMFGVARLDKVLENCAVGASDLLRSVLDELEAFTGGKAAHDDRTLLVAKIR
jgi:sigma-B regulation protein RsbU (phosphoserine phosphatase)